MHPGQRIGKYVLGEKIAVGGMAEVWAARAEGPEGFVKPVALKFILESFSGDPELEKLFVKEARIAARLQHANLVSVFDFDKVVVDPERAPSGRYYIAMEHVEGYDARRVAEAAKHAGYVFPLPLALYLGGEVMKGLRYVHERRENRRLLGLVHRDVSPHNVLIGFSGEVKLSDFGIAKSLTHSNRTRTGTIRGKLSYASPEQLNGEPVDHRADQFAMGITLWEIIAGRPLFDGNDEIEIVGKVMRCDVPSLGLVCPERKIAPSVEAFVRKMLSSRRDERFSTTADALSALLGLPGYSGDGVGLGELVRTLFHRASVGPASTMNLAAQAARVGARRAPAAPRAEGSRAAPGAAGDDHDREPPPSEIETRTMARAAGPGRRSPSGGRNVTTLQVRAGRDRRWAVMGGIAATAVVAIAVGAAVVASGGSATPSVQESQAPAPVAPRPPGTGAAEPRERTTTTPPPASREPPPPASREPLPPPPASREPPPPAASRELPPPPTASREPPPPTASREPPPPPPPTGSAQRMATGLPSPTPISTGSPTPAGPPPTFPEPSWRTLAVTAPGVPRPAAAPSSPPAVAPEAAGPAKPAPKPASSTQLGVPANGAPIVE